METTDESVEEQASRLRNEIDAIDRKPTEAYPPEIRGQVVAFIDRARSGTASWTWQRISEHLGIGIDTLRTWRDGEVGSLGAAEERGTDDAAAAEKTASADDEMVPVHVAGLAGGGGSSRSTAGDERLRLEVGGDLALEGLSFEQAIEAARRLR